MTELLAQAQRDGSDRADPRRKRTYRRAGGGQAKTRSRNDGAHGSAGEREPRWGYLRIRGELLTLGVRVSATAVRTVLRQEGLCPAPRRSGPSWSQFLRAQAQWILAFDVFPVETAWLRTLYVLFAMELGSRRVHVLGVTRNPDSAWVTQQARNVAVGEWLGEIRLLIRDRDSKYSSPFDEVFRTEGVRIVKTPIRAPRANAYAQRWVRTARRECLDNLDPRPTPPGASPWGVPDPLQREPTPPRPRVERTRAVDHRGQNRRQRESSRSSRRFDS
jgi:putative transposase